MKINPQKLEMKYTLNTDDLYNNKTTLVGHLESVVQSYIDFQIDFDWQWLVFTNKEHNSHDVTPLYYLIKLPFVIVLIERSLEMTHCAFKEWIWAHL